jgi:ribonuclease D
MPADEPQYVRTPALLQEAVLAVREAPVVGLDTEFVSEGVYEPQLCLVQVATPAGLWILDPLALRDLGDFWEAVTEPGRELVALAAREELRFCLRYAGRLPARLFDPQIAAGLTGFGYPLSHTNLARAVLGVRLRAQEALTDWRQRPLSSRQLEYAADDVRHLLALRERIQERARSLSARSGGDRSRWIEEECRRLAERVVAHQGDERWERTAGGAGLAPRELGVLRELWRWREDAAHRSNVPARRMMRDDLLVELAKRQPRAPADLFTLRALDRGHVRSAAPAILQAIQAGLSLPEAELPASLRRSDPPQVAVLAPLLAAVVAGLANAAQVDPALLAPLEDLRDLVRWRLAGAAASDDLPPLAGWRGEILRGPLLELLAGRRSVRVADLTSAFPLVLEEPPDPR